MFELNARSGSVETAKISGRTELVGTPMSEEKLGALSDLRHNPPDEADDEGGDEYKGEEDEAGD